MAGGRKRKLTDEDITKLKLYLRMKPSLEETALMFSMTPSGIEKFIKREFKMGFSDFRQLNMQNAALNVFRKAITEAESGNTAILLHLLKKMVPGMDESHASTQPINMTLSYALDGATIAKPPAKP